MVAVKKRWERHDCNISPFVIVQVGCWREKKARPHVGQAPLPGSSPELLWFVWNCDTVTVCFDVESWGCAMEAGYEGLSLERKGSEERAKDTTETNNTAAFSPLLLTYYVVSLQDLNIKSTVNPPKWPQLVCISIDEATGFKMWRMDIWLGTTNQI